MKLMGGWMDGWMVRQMTRPQGHQKSGGSSMREQSQAWQEMQQTPAKKRDDIPTVVPSLVYTPLSTFLPSLWSLSGLSHPLLPSHHVSTSSLWCFPFQIFFHTQRLLPADLYLSPHLPHSYPDLIYIYYLLYLPCTLLALAPLYLLYSVDTCG